MIIDISGQSIRVFDAPRFVAGSVNQYHAEVRFTAEWEEYNRFIVFDDYKNHTGENAIKIHLTDDTVTIPWEVLEEAGKFRIGCYGTNGVKRRPTIWTGRPMPVEAGPTDGTGGQQPTPQPWDELQGQIGDLSELQTENKDNLVDAINEVRSHGGGVMTVNGKEGPDVELNAQDVGALPENTKLKDLPGDAQHRTVSDDEKTEWDGKQDAIQDLPTIRQNAQNGANHANQTGNPHQTTYQQLGGTKPTYTASEVGALPDTTALKDLPDDAGHRTVSDEWKGQTEQGIAEAKAIARGKATGYVFDTVEDMQEWLEDPDHVALLNLGDNLYIRDTNVPDYWWDGTQAQELESEKPDLSPLATKQELSAHTGDTGIHTSNAEKTVWNGKQDAINDLDTLRTGAGKGETAYQKPAAGIPKTDLASGVQTSLGNADTALQSSDIDSTLSVAGKAADAKETGDALSTLSSEKADITQIVRTDLSQTLTEEQKIRFCENAETRYNGYKLIEEITLTDDVSTVERTITPNGDQYNFDEIYIETDISPTDTSISSVLRMQLHNGTEYKTVVYNDSWKSSPFDTMIMVNLGADVRTVLNTWGSTNSPVSNTWRSGYNTTRENFYGKKIKGVKIYTTTTGVLLKTGSVIKIFAKE